MGYVPLYSPGDMGETAFVESLLKSNRVRYIVQNDVASRVQAGLSLNQVTFYVHPDDLRRAEGLLRGPRSNKKKAPVPKRKKRRKSIEASPRADWLHRTGRYALTAISLLALYMLYRLTHN